MKKTKPTPVFHPLCYRCEHRARFLEGGSQPRYECGQPGAIFSCYMFEPMKPLLLARDGKDRRPFPAGWAFSARVHSPGIAKSLLNVSRQSGKVVVWHKPME